jgi:hypothetical protein
MKLERVLPVGIRPKTELWAFLTVYVSAIAFSCQFFTRYNQWTGTAETSFVGAQAFQYPDCAHLMDGTMLGFEVLILASVLLAVYHYLYHWRGSRSIYLMRRLPGRGELARRCLTVPAVMIVVCLLTAVVLTLIFYTFYMDHVPPANRLADQWQLLWSESRRPWLWGGLNSGGVTNYA